MPSAQIASISVCIIVKNEPQFEQCLLSLRPYVKEIVIVDTGSTDSTIEIAKKYADIFESYAECNDPETGLINSFCKARQRSFDLATQPFCMWIDSDDVLEGADQLYNIISQYEELAKTQTICLLLPYEYSYDEKGNCNLKHYRERIFNNKQNFYWQNDVHEVCIPKTNIIPLHITLEYPIYKHKRQFNKKSIENGRNLRILQKYMAENAEPDTRQLYYYGLELINNGMVSESIESLTKYVDKSGWPDEQYMACLKLIDIYQALGDYKSGITWGLKAITFQEQWAEGYLALGKMYYFLAEKHLPDEYRCWEKSIYFIKLGLSLPITKTLLFVNPLEREYEIHKFYNVSLSRVGKIVEALESCNLGLSKNSNDPNLIANKYVYQRILSHQNLINILEQFRILNLNNSVINSILSLINNPDSFIKKEKMIENNLSDVILYEDRMTDSSKLDIVFMAGDGLEVWNGSSKDLGGSETMLLQMAKGLADKGHKVRVYNSCGNTEGLYDGVEYHLTSRFHDLNCDVLVISRQTTYLADQYNINAKVKYLWVHDVLPLGFTNQLLLKADRILCLSDWHKENVINFCNVHPSHIIKTRNGVDLKLFDKKIDRKKYKFINSSSPDRSWPILLSKIWPRIKEKFPEGELHLFYGFYNWEKSAVNNPAQLDLIASLKKQIEDMKGLGVVYHGRVNQEVLAEEMMSSNVLLYSTWFNETFYIGGAQCLLAGTRFVGSNIAAIKETVGKYGRLIDGEWTNQDYQDRFVQAAIEAVDDSDREPMKEYARKTYNLETLIDSWEEMFYNLIEEVKTNPIIPYYPTAQYRLIEDKIYSKMEPEISIVVPTMRPGGLDILLKSLSKQTFKNFELIICDGIYKYRKDLISKIKDNYDFTIKHIEPTKNVFPISCASNAYNSGFINAEADIVLMITDYSYLPEDCVEKHVKFHKENPQENIGYMCPHQYKSLPELNKDFPTYQNPEYQKLVDDLDSGKFDSMMFSIFKDDFDIDPESLPLDSMGNADTKLFMPYGEGDQNSFNGKNESVKMEAILKINGWSEECDGTHSVQDNLFSDMLVKKLGLKWIVDATNKLYIINPRFVMPWANRIRPYQENKPIWDRMQAEGYKNRINDWDLRKARNKILNKEFKNELKEFEKGLKDSKNNPYKVLTGEAKLKLDCNALEYGKYNIPLKLNLACGTDLKNGWLNLDAIARWPNTSRGCDIIWDARKDLIPFANNTVDEVRTGELFLHTPKIYHDFILADIIRVMKPCSTFTVNDVDMEWAMKEWLKNPSDKGLIKLIWGTQHDDWADFDRHCSGFTAESLKEMLEEAGFINLQRINIHNPEVTKYELTYTCQKAKC